MILMRKSACLLFVVSLMVSLMVSLPRTGFSSRHFSLQPKLTIGWRYDSNYFKEEKETEVYSYLVQPGIDLGYHTAKSYIVLGYTLDGHYYDEQDRDPFGRDIEELIGHTLSLESRTKPSDRVMLGLDESFYKTNDPVYTDVISNKQVRDEYSINRLTPRLLYEFGPRFTSGVRYRRTDLEYGGENEEDSTEHRGIFNLIYYLTRRTSLDLQYQHSEMNYDANLSDYTSDQMELILERQFHHFSFAAGGGYHKRDFDDPGIKSIDAFTCRIRIKGQNPPAPIQPRSHVLISAVQDLNMYADLGDYFEARRFTLEVGHVFMEKLPAKIRGVYQESNYESVTPIGVTAGREDESYGLQASLGFIFSDWITVTAAVGYEERDSNLAGLDYENDYCLVTLDFTYDVGSK
jgi:hypothetical protein